MSKEHNAAMKQVGSPDGGVGWRVDVDFNLRPTGTVADPLPNLASSPVSVWQVVEPGQGVGQQADIGTAETEASALRPPFPCPDTSWPGLALLSLVFVWSVADKK